VALEAGSRLGPYEVVGLLGSGGMGEVYRARDPRLEREVAIKVLTGEVVDSDRLRRFEREARAASALNHPNVLAVYDVGAHEGAPYVVSELLEGQTLRVRLEGGALPVRKALEQALEIAHGLAAAHDKGIVHRDLKPDNVFITEDGRVKILDFGLAKLTRAPLVEEADQRTATQPTEAGVVMGTVGYMSPEQVRGEGVDPRSDIFSLGAVLFEMLTGTRAFRRPSAAETMNAILKEDPPELSGTGRGISPGIAQDMFLPNPAPGRIMCYHLIHDSEDDYCCGRRGS
jgi:serine/threonine protein kinase